MWNESEKDKKINGKHKKFAIGRCEWALIWNVKIVHSLDHSDCNVEN